LIGLEQLVRTHHLRVLIANQRPDRLELLATVVTGLGHEVIAREINVTDVASVTARLLPDVALVGLGESSDHALALITEIARGTFCPVIALLETYDAEWIDLAAERGVYAYIVETRPDELQSAIDITLRRFGEMQSTQGALDRRNAEAARDTKVMLNDRRRIVAHQDGVVQGLVAAQRSLARDRTEDTREGLLEALESARLVVTRSLDELTSRSSRRVDPDTDTPLRT
jgi:AmiR/NasT family two-component response regulator